MGRLWAETSARFLHLFLVVLSLKSRKDRMPLPRPGPLCNRTVVLKSINGLQGIVQEKTQPKAARPSCQ
jgi:hypothetical protein